MTKIKWLSERVVQVVPPPIKPKTNADRIRSMSIENINASAEAMRIRRLIKEMPSADVVEIPKFGIGDLSDGYHTFNGLYYQRMVLFAALVKTYKSNAWKSWKHENGEPCFGGGWFIVGIDTPQGSYTYHYEDKYWNWFECEELSVAKHWDGHTEKDVTRLMSIDVVERKHGKWEMKPDPYGFFDEIPVCSECGCTTKMREKYNFCPNCGADNREVASDEP